MTLSTAHSGIVSAAARSDFFAPTVPDMIIPPWYSAVFVIVIVIVAVFVLVIVLIVRNARRAKQLGVDPTTMQTDMAARYLRHGVGPAGSSLTDRLAELDRLRAAGTISAEEHARAREAALTGDRGPDDRRG
ncbi:MULTISPECIES: SHOCT domain-containing protein [unclassified Rathayibacter]|uniref:SHOCT domain-containing protein n=1 Tax=unclassified Rathayibacter TaxID=2609250 RepID=UPI000F4B0191|nr:MULTISPECIES: SHOCT domain-containing protein [unclassified Rathayibacter]ROP50371.1 hypothetical protein EDF45_1782 [Rathayibacter sp. PhB186]ROS53330.1 hypothetical protein EDF44_1783 [Rathayibacter sp. PhB185]